MRFAGFDIGFHVITVRHRYDIADLPAGSERAKEQITSERFIFGAGTRAVPGRFQATLEKTACGIAWQATAYSREPTKGILTTIGPLPVGRVVIPLRHVYQLADGEAQCFVFPCGHYPLRHSGTSGTGIAPQAGPLPWWGAQMALIESPAGIWCLRGEESPWRWKRLWVRRSGEQMWLTVMSQAHAYDRQCDFATPRWRLERVPSTVSALADYRDWMASAYGLVPFEQRRDVPAWVKDIGLVVSLHGHGYSGKLCHTFQQMSTRLDQLANLFPARRILIKIVGFNGRQDFCFPSTAPDQELGGDEGFKQLLSHAHELGFHIIPHLNTWGCAYDSPLYKRWRRARVRDDEGRPVGWWTDRDGDEVEEDIFAYISPDSPGWRAVLRNEVGRLVHTYNVDAIYFDQATTYVNDPSHNHHRGVTALYREMQAAFPQIVFGGEAVSEQTLGLFPLTNLVNLSAPEAYRALALPFVRSFMCDPPIDNHAGVWTMEGERSGWSAERLDRQVTAHEAAGALPGFAVADAQSEISGPLVRRILARAREYT